MRIKNESGATSKLRHFTTIGMFSYWERPYSEFCFIADTIVEALPGKQENDRGYIQKGEDIVTWCFGHTLELHLVHQYDERYKKWKMVDLPIFFPQWALQSIPEKKQQIDTIRQLLKNADLPIHAGDMDEEGQLIVDELL